MNRSIAVAKNTRRNVFWTLMTVLSIYQDIWNRVGYCQCPL